MTIDVWLAFVVASTVLLAMPGPTVLTVISYSIRHGWPVKATLVVAVALGDATALAFSLLGLGSLLAASAVYFNLVKWLGGMYLLFLGIRMLRTSTSAGRPAVELDVSLASRWRLFINTYLVTALNPKGIVFFLAFLPQFVDPTGDAPWQLFLLALTFVCLGAVNAALYAGFAGLARQALLAPGTRRGISLTGGLLLAVAGIWTLLIKRPA